MKKVIRLFTALLLFLCLPLYSAFAEDSIKYPKPTEMGYVNDYAGILDSSTEQKIFSMGQELDTKTKAQVVVVTINKLPGDASIEEYANGLFREWGIGDKKLNNGILLIVNTDPNNRVARIEVGDGLEGRVPDAIANRIMEDVIIPYFKQGDYNSGILNGYYSLVNKVAEEYNVKLSGNPGNVYIPEGSQNQRNSNLPLILAVLFFFLFDGIFFRFRIFRFILFMLATNNHRGGRGGGGFGGGSGGGFGGFGGGSSSGGGANGKW